MHAAFVGDHRHRRIERIFLLVERQHLLAVAGTAGDERLVELGHVIGMARAAEVEHHVIGDVDNRGDRPLAGALQPALHPLGGAAVGQPADRPPIESRAPLRILDADCNGRSESAGDLRHLQRLQGSDACRGKIARDPANAHAVGPVGRDRDVEDRIVELRIFGEGGADRGIFRELDYPFMLVAKLELADRAHHAVAFDAPDRGDLQSHVASGHVGAGRAEHAEHSGAGVGGAAYDLDWPVTRIDAKHLQLVGLRVLGRGQHPRDLERRQRFGGVGDLFHLQPDRGHPLGDGFG